jgi:hypothetical protein
MTADELRKLFPRESADFVDANTGLQGPQFERTLWDGTLAAAERKAASVAKRFVRITSLRARAVDPDNLCCKYLIDALRHTGILEDDTPDHIELTVAQKKVKHRREEKTLIEIH